MRFVKMHGIGNDYVFVNGFAEHVPDPAALALRIADRHTGVGGDGLILLLPPEPQAQAAGAGLRMRMFNADGSEAEMCGNGVRCVCKLAIDDRVVEPTNPLRVQTGAGILTLAHEAGPDGKVGRVSVDMGEPTLAAERIPVQWQGAEVIDAPLQPHADAALAHEPGWAERCGLDLRMTCVSMGNPHVIMYCRDVAAVPLERVGPVLETLPLFPRRVNVHFVEVHSAGEATMRTWERGSGITLACGTGASAVCVAGVLTGRTGRELLAHLPGGDLELVWRADDNHIVMTGPAAEVFRGDWPG